MIADVVVAVLLVASGVATLVAAIGLWRLPDFFMRLHGPTKTTTLGVGAMVMASAIYFSVSDPGISLHEIAATMFLFITAPVSAHLLAKAALHIAQKPNSEEKASEEIITQRK